MVSCGKTRIGQAGRKFAYKLTIPTKAYTHYPKPHKQAIAIKPHRKTKTSPLVLLTLHCTSQSYYDLSFLVSPKAASDLGFDIAGCVEDDPAEGPGNPIDGVERVIAGPRGLRHGDPKALVESIYDQSGFEEGPHQVLFVLERLLSLDLGPTLLGKRNDLTQEGL